VVSIEALGDGVELANNGLAPQAPGTGGVPTPKQADGLLEFVNFIGADGGLRIRHVGEGGGPLADWLQDGGAREHGKTCEDFPAAGNVVSGEALHDLHRGVGGQREVERHGCCQAKAVPLIRDVGHVIQELVQLAGRELQNLTDAWPQPRLGLGLATLPADDRGAFTAKGTCQPFLGVAEGLAALGEAQALERHGVRDVSFRSYTKCNRSSLVADTLSEQMQHLCHRGAPCMRCSAWCRPVWLERGECLIGACTHIKSAAQRNVG
jgi:hypothetical protein